MNFDFSKVNEIINRCKDKAPKANYKCSVCRDVLKEVHGFPV